MTVGGLVAEFNPFHRGHAYCVDQLRRQGITHLVAVMSGSFVQRGDAAVCDKGTRAEMALAGGVDLVLELPLPFAAATAQRFALGGVGTLAALGCVERLGFGSECGDTARLERAAALLETEAVRSELRRLLGEGMPFAAARQQALTEAGGEGALLARPNDTLAIAYLQANAALGHPLTPTAVRRMGAGHDGAPDGGIASASWIRQRLADGDEAAAVPYLTPESAALLTRDREAGRCPASLDRLETAMLAALRTRTEEQLAALPDVSEGLEHRLYRAIREAGSVADILDAVKVKRYTHARLRRILLYALLELDRGVWSDRPRYLHVLAMNERGRELMAACRPTLPWITRAKDRERLDEAGRRMWEAECRADDLFALAQPTVQPCGRTLTQGVIIR